jgi:hypothetical protein
MAFASSHAWLVNYGVVRVFNISTPATPSLRNTVKIAPGNERAVAFRFTDPLALSAMVLTDGGHLVRLTTSNPDFPGPIQMVSTGIDGYDLTFDGARLHAAGGEWGYRVFNLSFTGPPAENPAAPPPNRTICPSGPTTLMAFFVADPAPSSYRWHKSGIPLNNGPTGSGSTLSGADTPVLTITAAGPADIGQYFCRAVNTCGSADSSTSVLSECYANCDCSFTPPILNVADFTCFLQGFAAGSAFANCDNSTTVPTLNVADFTCFLQRFAAGCP